MVKKLLAIHSLARRGRRQIFQREYVLYVPAGSQTEEVIHTQIALGIFSGEDPCDHYYIERGREERRGIHTAKVRKVVTKLMWPSQFHCWNSASNEIIHVIALTVCSV